MKNFSKKSSPKMAKRSATKPKRTAPAAQTKPANAKRTAPAAQMKPANAKRTPTTPKRGLATAQMKPANAQTKLSSPSPACKGRKKGAEQPELDEIMEIVRKDVKEVVGKNYRFAPLKKMIEEHERQPSLIALMLALFKEDFVSRSKYWKNLSMQFYKCYREEIADLTHFGLSLMGLPYINVDDPELFIWEIKTRYDCGYFKGLSRPELAKWLLIYYKMPYSLSTIRKKLSEPTEEPELERIFIKVYNRRKGVKKKHGKNDKSK